MSMTVFDFTSPQKGTYLPQTYIIHEEMVVTGKAIPLKNPCNCKHR
jgi:hypothetical protein